MMKLEDMEDADPRYATAVEVADLRKTLDDFTRAQDLHNKSIQGKLDKLSKFFEQVNPCVEDPFSKEGMEKANWEDCPWSASELEAFYENAYQELPLEPIKPPPVVTSNTFTVVPAKCSTDCSSQDKNALPPRTAVLRTEEELHKESPTLIQAHVVLDDMQQRGPGSYILSVEAVNISPKPPWPITCLEAHSVKGNFNSQKCYKCWLSFSDDSDVGQQRSPWPPPIQQQMQCMGVQPKQTLWHSFPLVKLSLGGGRRFHFGATSFLMAMHLLNLLPVLYAQPTTKIQTLTSRRRMTQMQTKSEVSMLCWMLWPLLVHQQMSRSFQLAKQLLHSLSVMGVKGTSEVYGLGCSSHGRVGITKFFLWQCELTAARISHKRNELHISFWWIEYPQFNGLTTTTRLQILLIFSANSTQLLVFSGNSVKWEANLVMMLIHLASTSALKYEFIMLCWKYNSNGRIGIAKFLKCHNDMVSDEISGQKNVLQYWHILVQKQHHLSSWLSTRTIKSQQVMPWNIVSQLVYIISLAVISTSAEQCQLIPPSKWSHFHSGDDLDKETHLQSCWHNYNMPSSFNFSMYKVLLVDYKLWCSFQLWKKPRMPSVYKFLQWWCTDTLKCKGELNTNENFGQKKVPQYLQISVGIWYATITNQKLVLWDLDGNQGMNSNTQVAGDSNLHIKAVMVVHITGCLYLWLDCYAVIQMRYHSIAIVQLLSDFSCAVELSLHQMLNSTAAHMLIGHWKLPMEHISASSSTLIDSILSSASTIPFGRPNKLPAIHVCVYQARTGSILTEVAGSLIVKLWFDLVSNIARLPGVMKDYVLILELLLEYMDESSTRWLRCTLLEMPEVTPSVVCNSIPSGLAVQHVLYYPGDNPYFLHEEIVGNITRYFFHALRTIGCLQDLTKLIKWLHSEPAILKWAQIHVSPDWVACTTCQTKPEVYKSLCTCSNEINTSLSIEEALFKSQEVLPGASVVVTKTEMVIITSSLPASVPDQREVLPCLVILVQQQQLSNVSFTSIRGNQKLLTFWDPGGDPYFLDNCKSLDCLINLALIPLSSSTMKQRGSYTCAK